MIAITNLLDVDAILHDHPEAIRVDISENDFYVFDIRASFSYPDDDSLPPDELAKVDVVFRSPITLSEECDADQHYRIKYGGRVMSMPLIPWLEYDPIRTEKALDDLLNKGFIVFNRRLFINKFREAIRMLNDKYNDQSMERVARERIDNLDDVLDEIDDEYEKRKTREYKINWKKLLEDENYIKDFPKKIRRLSLCIV